MGLRVCGVYGLGVWSVSVCTPAVMCEQCVDSVCKVYTSDPGGPERKQIDSTF